MKQFFQRHRHSIFIRSLYAASMSSLVFYGILRALFYEFPMHWTDELLFFIKTTLLSCLVIVIATGLPAGLHKHSRQKK